MTLDGFLAAFKAEAPATEWRVISSLWETPGLELRCLYAPRPDHEGTYHSPLTYVAIRRGCPTFSYPTFMPIRISGSTPAGAIGDLGEWRVAANYLGLSEGDTRVLQRASDAAWFHDRRVRFALYTYAAVWCSKCGLPKFECICEARSEPPREQPQLPHHERRGP